MIHESNCHNLNISLSLKEAMYDDTATLLPRSRRVVAESRRDLGIIVTQCFLVRERDDREVKVRIMNTGGGGDGD